jgi:hypothetical protein
VISRLLKELERRGAIEFQRGYTMLRYKTKLGGLAGGVDAKQ